MTLSRILRRVFFLMAVFCVWLPGQQPGQPATDQTPGLKPPVIQVETRLVLVDAVVTDKKGEYIRDLTAKQFRVWEDNKEQKVKNFSFEADPASPTKSQPRYLVLFFDNSTMDPGDQVRARDAARKFIESNAGPNRLMAIVNFGGSLQIAQNFTDDVDRLRAVVSGLRTSSVSPNAVASLGMPRLGGAVGDFGVRSMILALRSLAKNLASIPGRKSLVLLTSGFRLRPEQISEITATIDMCNRSNVAIYPIDVRGLFVPMPGAGVPGVPRSSVSPPASETGGRTAQVGQASTPAIGGMSFGTRIVAGLSRLGLATLQAPGPWQAWTPASLVEPQNPPQVGGGQAPPTTGGSTGGGTPPSTGGGTGGIRPPSGGGDTGGGMRPPSTGNTGGGATGSPGWTAGPGRGQPGGATPGYGNTNAPGYGNASRGGAGGGMPDRTFERNQQNQPRILLPRFPEILSGNHQVMEMLADGTGGFVIRNTNDLLGGLEKIGKEQNEYYLLAYTPPESEEGSCHTLRVKVDRGGATVRARTGYCNVKKRDVLAGKQAETELEARVAAVTAVTATPPGAAGTAPGASVQCPFFFTSANVARVNVAMEIPTGSIQFEKLNGKQHAAINVLGLAYKPDGTVAARFSDTVKLDFDDKKQVEAFKEKPFHYENQFDIASGIYRFKVGYTSSGQTFGKADAPLVVDAYDNQQFSMSGIAFSKDMRPAADIASGIDALLIEDRTPLIFEGRRMIPSGSNRFNKKEPALIYFEVYEPELFNPDPAKPVVVAVQMRVLDRKTGVPRQDSGMFKLKITEKGGNPVIPVGLKMQVAALEPGSYRLELTAADGLGKVSKRVTDFEVEQ